MSGQAELAEIIDRADWTWGEEKTVSTVDEWSQDIAKAVLAAGYRKPRTIETIEELDALPAGTIIRDPLPCIKWGSGMWGTFSGDSVISARIDLPATVLFEGGATS